MITSLILLIPGILFASIESSNPTPEELVKVLNYEAWKLELESIENLEFKVEYFRYNELKEVVGAGTFEWGNDKRNEVYIVIYQDGKVLIRFFGEHPLGGAGSEFAHDFANLSQGMKRIELPKEIEIGERFPILESKSEEATVYFTIQRKQ